MDVIYCAGGNIRLAKIAVEEGFMYGTRSDDTPSLRCNGLVDINWKNYNWEKHLKTVSKHSPAYAVVPDILNIEELPEALQMAKQLKYLCKHVIMVPKTHDIVRYIPSEYVVGISVPTSYSGFLPTVQELYHRRVHLLGGSPRQQRILWRQYIAHKIIVTSIDVNSHNKASDYGSYWDGEQWRDHERQNGIGKYEAFRKSCKGIMHMWKSLGAIS